MVTDAGTLFRLAPSRLKQPGVESRAFEELELPPNLDQPLLAERLHDGRLVIVANGAAPQMWIVETSGALGKPQKLPESLLLPPILLDAGWVLPRPGRLTVQAISAGSKFDDWRAPAQAESPAPWTALVRLSGTELLLGDATGRWRRLQVRMGDIPHLAEAQSIELPPLRSTPRLTGETLVILDEAGRLHQLDAHTLDDSAQRSLTADVTGFDCVRADLVLAWAPGVLHGVPLKEFEAGGWTLPLDGLNLVGRPLISGDQARLASANGVVVTFDWKTGKELHRETLPQGLTGRLVTIENDDYAIALDGAVYRLSPGKESSP